MAKDAASHYFQIVIDALREVIPPFSPAEVVSNIAVSLCKAYRVTKVWGDNYAGEFAKEPFRKAGIFYDLWKQHKSEIYRDPLLPLIYSKRITLPRNDRLINQACTLERSVKRSGRDEITHPTHGHDDVVNAAAGAAAVALRFVEQDVPFVVPFIWSKTSGVISDPCRGAKVDTTAEFYRRFAATYDRWRPNW